MGDDDGDNEIKRLRAIGAWMREVGASELELGELRIKLAPRQPVLVPAHRADPEEERALSDEERQDKELRDAEREHIRQWERITRSSGAPIPAFKRQRSA